MTSAAVLSTLSINAYWSNANTPEPNDSLGGVLQGSGWLALALMDSDGTEFEDHLSQFQLGQTYTFDFDGFFARAYSGPSGIVISFRGTETDSLYDLVADATLGLGTITNQLRAAYFYTQFIKSQNPGAAITFTGHSLGGALATAMAALEGANATVFNPAPVTASLIALVRGLPANGDWPEIPARLINGVSVTTLAQVEQYLDQVRPGEIISYVTNGEVVSYQLSTAQGDYFQDSRIVFDVQGSVINLESVLKPRMHSIDLAAFLVMYGESRNFIQLTAAFPRLLEILFAPSVTQFASSGSLIGALLSKSDAADKFLSDLQLLDDASAQLTPALRDMLMQLAVETSADQLDVSNATAFSQLLGVATTNQFISIDLSKMRAGVVVGADTNLLTATMTGKLGLADALHSVFGITSFSLDDFQTVRIGLGTSNVAIQQSSQPGVLFSGNDLIVTGAGNDTIFGSASSDYIVGGAGTDTLDYAQLAAGVGITVTGSPEIGKFTVTKNSSGQDTLSQIERITGTNAKDTFNAGSGDDLFDGSAGDDLFAAGRLGNDGFIGGDGIDTADYRNIGNGTTPIVVQMMAENAFTIAKPNGGTDTLTGIERVITTNQIDTLIGTSGADALVVVAGSNDKIDGVNGNDTLDLTNLKGNISASYDSTGIKTAQNYSTVDGVTVLTDIKGFNVENVSFASDARLFAVVTGSAGARVSGTVNQDVIVGGVGADTILGNGGVDIIRAGDGSDTIQGDEGNDLLDGGLSNDVYIYELGDGLDTISDRSGNDTIQFGDGINAAEVTYQVDSSGDLTIYIGGQSCIVVRGQSANGNRGIETLQFSNGQTISLKAPEDPTLLLPQLSAMYSGSPVLTTQNNYQWSWTTSGVLGGMGSIELKTFIGDFSLPFSAWPYGNVPGRAELGIQDNIIILPTLPLLANGIDVFSRRELMISGSIGDDLMIGTEHNDWLIGGLNAPAIEALTGQQIFSYRGHVPTGYLSDAAFWANFSDNDTLYGMGGNDMLGGEDGDDLLDGGEGDDRLYGEGGNDELFGGSGNDSLFGGGGSDYLVGGDGSDRLDGGSGADEADGGLGDDLYLGFDPLAILSDSGGQDILQFNSSLSSLTIYRVGNDLIVNGVIIKDQYLSVQNRIEVLRLADGDFDITSLPVEPQLGTSGSDVLNGTQYPDQLYGNEGDDSLIGGGGRDTLVGGVGNDSLNGGAGDDTYKFNFGWGSDTISDTQGSNILQFDASVSSEDISITWDENDLIISNIDSGDVIRIVGMYLSGQLAFSEIGFANGDEIDPSDDYFDGGEGNDVYGGSPSATEAYGNGGNDQLGGGAGNDYIEGGSGNDTITGGAGADELYGDADSDNIDGGDGADYIEAGSGNDFIAGGLGDDEIYGDAGDDFIDGGGNTDYIEAGSGNDTLRGGAGEDELYGDDGNDDLSSGSDGEYDYMEGGLGNDIYRFGVGYGDDEIYDEGGSDSLYLGSGLTALDIEIFGNGSDIFITIISTGETLTIDNALSSSRAIEQIVFSDGTSIPLAIPSRQISGTNADDVITGDLSNDTIYGLGGADTISGGSNVDALYGDAGNDIINGDAGADTLYGGDGADSLTGGAGSDTLYGNQGDDSYLFGRGDGADLINDTLGAGSIIFKTGIAPADIAWSYAQGKFTLSIIGTSDSITFGASSYISELRFADGTVINRSADVVYTGTGANENIYGGRFNDTLNGGGGDDGLIGQDGNDLLDGGLGNDVLYGEAGDDVYLWGAGVGNDRIQEYGGGIDVLQLAPGISSSNVTIARGGYDFADLIITLSSGEKLTITNQNYSGGDATLLKVETLRFADGSEIDLKAQFAINGDEANNVIFGGAGPDLIQGHGGNDYLNGFGGNDTLDGGSGADSLYGGTNDDILNGSAGSDSLYGEAGNDSLNGGDGNDQLYGGIGNDTYLFGVASGSDAINEDGGNDVIQLAAGITPDQLRFVRNSNFLIISLTSGDTLTLVNHFIGDANRQVETLRFADGQEINLTAGLSFSGTSGNDLQLQGSNFNDTMLGLAGNDDISAYSGNDLLDGGIGNDTLRGGAGDDIYIWGANNGNDQIDEMNSGGADSIHLASGITENQVRLSKSGSNLIITLPDGEALTINQHTSANYAVEKLIFSDGVQWDLTKEILTGWTNNDTLTAISGNGSIIKGRDGDDILIGAAGNDTLSADGGNDTLDGGAGNDLLNGGLGNDVYKWSSGNDTIIESGGSDIILFGAGIVAADVSLAVQGMDLLVTVAGNTLKIIGHFNASRANRVEKFKFADGSEKVINIAPVAVVDSAIAATEDTAITILKSDLLSNDTDIDGDTLTITSVQGAVNGSVSLNGAGNVVFAPTTNFNGTATFTYTVSDGNGGSTTETVSVTVNAVNDAPAVVNDTASMNEDGSLTLQASALLTNDSDAESDNLTVTFVGNASTGTVTLTNGEITFTPAANFAGTATFTYTASDGNGGTTQGTVTVTVNNINDAPTATVDTVSGNEDSAITITAASLLANDTDIDGNTLTITSVQGATNGTVSLNGTDVIFTPIANFNGQTTFTYTVSDGNGGTATQTVTVNVANVNDAPVAVTDSKSTDEDTAITILKGDLLGNDTDIDGDAVSITSVQSATHGTVSLDGSGNVLFTPDANYNGSATFTYTVSDGNGGTHTQTVSMTINAVNDAPVANDDTGSATLNTAKTFILSDLLANDSDPEGHSLSIDSVGNASHGTVSIDGNGTVVFTPETGFTGTASFTYTLKDQPGLTDNALVTVSVAA